MNIHERRQERITQHMSQRDDIEKPEPPATQELCFLSEKKLRFVAAWTGNIIAAARTAGYKDAKGAAYKLMKDPEVIKALQKKQASMLQESGEHLARTLPLSRADVIDRLWQLAQLGPESTNGNISGQVKAAQTLEQVFALNMDQNELIQRQLDGKSEAEIEFYVIHGFLPFQEEKAPALQPSAEPQQLPESTAAIDSPTLQSTSQAGEAALTKKKPQNADPAATSATSAAAGGDVAR